MIQTVFFYCFAALTLAGALLTITRRSALIAAVWLTVSLLGVAGLFLVLGSEFLFVAQILVYIGGITLLFLFVIMLVNLETVRQVKPYRRGAVLVALLSAALTAELVAILRRQPLHFSALPQGSNTNQIADALLSSYAVPFEIASVLLLVAIIGSVWMGQER